MILSRIKHFLLTRLKLFQKCTFVRPFKRTTVKQISTIKNQFNKYTNYNTLITRRVPSSKKDQGSWIIIGLIIHHKDSLLPLQHPMQFYWIGDSKDFNPKSGLRSGKLDLFIWVLILLVQVDLSRDLIIKVPHFKD